MRKAGSKPAIVKVPEPLTSTELREAIGKATEAELLFTPKGTDPPSARPPKKTSWEHPVFSQCQILGIGHYEDTVGITATGREHRFSGGTYIDFTWGATDIGFGRFRLERCNDGKIEIDTEGTGREFFLKFLKHLVDSAKDISERPKELVKAKEASTQ